MRNRAKCRLCRDIIASIYQHDYVTCKCGEIAVDGGSGFGFVRHVWKTDKSNLIALDDEGKEICQTITDPVTQEELDILCPKENEAEESPIEQLEKLKDRLGTSYQHDLFYLTSILLKIFKSMEK